MIELPLRGARIGLSSLVILSSTVSGCALFPGSGPLMDDIVSEAKTSLQYEVFEVDGKAINAMSHWHSASLAETFGSRSPAPENLVSIGDQVQVSIWEASGGGLFGGGNVSETSSGNATLPVQTVGRDGRIKVPYVGDISVEGKRPSTIAKQIEEALKGKAIEPQVLVTMPDQASASVVVMGDLTGAGRVSLNVKGDRLLEVIAQAGGVKGAAHETFVRITRGSHSSTMQMSAILATPKENIYMRPGDTVYVFKKPQTYTALGALKNAGEMSIDREDFMLASAVGLSKGLSDSLADPRGIFIFRFEQPDVVKAINPSSRFLNGKNLVPVIYRLNMKDPAGYFLARAFPIRVGDVVYVANAPSVEFNKFLKMVQTMSSVIRSNAVAVSD